MSLDYSMECMGVSALKDDYPTTVPLECSSHNWSPMQTPWLTMPATVASQVSCV